MKAILRPLRPSNGRDTRALKCSTGRKRGIFGDMDMADKVVIMSDTYYGDWSSVMHLYQKTGKPMMIQSVDI